jgi:hypothetical protein
MCQKPYIKMELNYRMQKRAKFISVTYDIKIQKEREKMQYSGCYNTGLLDIIQV